MDTLFFCRDGILRRNHHVHNHKTREHITERVPLQVYEAAVDQHAFLKSLTSAIHFEDGLTVGEMMENLAPWAETMIGVGVLDFPAFLEELRREPKEIVEDVDQIVLRYSAEISPVPKFSKRFRADGKELLFGNPTASGQLQLEQRWHMDAMLTEAGQEKYEGSKTVAIDYTPMSEWKHLPIVISDKAVLQDTTVSELNQVYLGHTEPLTSAEHPNVEATPSSNGKVFRHEIAIEAPTPTFFNTLIRSFMWDVGFSFSPAQRDDLKEELNESMEAIEAGTVTCIDSEDILADFDPEDRGEESLESFYDLRRQAEFESEMARLTALRAKAAEMGLPTETKSRTDDPDDYALGEEDVGEEEE